MRLVCLTLCTLLSVVGWNASAAGRDRDAVGVVPFDSGTRVVREVAEVLGGDGRSILEAYPRGSEVFLGLVSLLPERVRIAAIEWGMRRSVGHAAERADDVSVDALAEGCVAQYPGADRYPVIMMGSPNGAVAHLAALLRAPFLTTSFGLTFRHAPIDPDDLASYLETSVAAAERIVAGNPDEGYEIVCHYDPHHDRSMVQAADFLRVKLHALPDVYREFIRDRLAPDGTLVLIDCAYSWPQIALGERIFLQIGGLGAIEARDYLERWLPDAPAETRRESEWGCPEGFAVSVTDYAAECGTSLVEVSRDHPADYSLLAYNVYLACEGVRSDTILIDCFNHQNPRTNLATGIPALWLPFNTADGLDLVERALRDKTPDTIFFAPLPSFARSPDTVPLETWAELLSPYGPIEWIGVRPRSYPADPLAPYRFVRDMATLRDTFALKPSLYLPIEELATILLKTP